VQFYLSGFLGLPWYRVQLRSVAGTKSLKLPHDSRNSRREAIAQRRASLLNSRLVEVSIQVGVVVFCQLHAIGWLVGWLVWLMVLLMAQPIHIGSHLEMLECTSLIQQSFSSRFELIVLLHRLEPRFAGMHQSCRPRLVVVWRSS